MICPHCHGENVQRLAVIHAAGTTLLGASHHVQDGFGPGATIETSGYRQSLLASSAAPPAGKSLLSPLVLVAVGAIIMYDALKLRHTFFGVDWSKFWISASLIGVGVILVLLRWRYNVVQSQHYRAWSRSWLCHSCGTKFERS